MSAASVVGRLVGQRGGGRAPTAHAGVGAAIPAGVPSPARRAPRDRRRPPNAAVEDAPHATAARSGPHAAVLAACHAHGRTTLGLRDRPTPASAAPLAAFVERDARRHATACYKNAQVVGRASGVCCERCWAAGVGMRNVRRSGLSGMPGCPVCPAARYVRRSGCPMCPAVRLPGMSGAGMPGHVRLPGMPGCPVCPSCPVCPAARMPCPVCPAVRLPGCPVCPAVRMPGCPACPAARYARLPGMPGCPVCPAARYARLSGMPGCPVCPAARYARLPGMPGCPAVRRGVTG